MLLGCNSSHFSLGLSQEMALQLGDWTYHIVGQFCQGLLKKNLFYPQDRPYEEKHNTVQARTQRTFLKIFQTFQRPSCPMPSSWRREVAAMPNSLRWSRLLK